MGFLLAGAIALSIAHSVYRVPIQVSDSLDAILLSRHADSTLTLLADTARASETTLRPWRYVQARWLSSLAESTGVSYHFVFRGTHAALAVLLVGLLAWIADPRRWSDVAALAFGLTVLIGLHTFDAMMREAFPVNHYAEVAAASLFVMGAALRPPRASRQLAAIVLLAGGMLLIESSVLVWLVIVACAAVGLPGIRLRTAIAATLVLVVLLTVRFSLGISSPGVGSHNTGWGAVVLSGEEAQTRFGNNPLPLYAYNVIGGALSLLASEPRFGVYQLLYSRVVGYVSPVIIINIVSSLLTTAGIAWCCAAGLRRLPRRWDDETRTLAVSATVIIVSAGLCVTYIKDDILSTAGVFYAVMALITARWLAERKLAEVSVATAVAGTALILIASCAWAFRAVGTHYELTRTAFTTRNDWVLKSTRDLAGGDRATTADVGLTQKIRAESLRQPVASPSFLPEWSERYWIE